MTLTRNDKTGRWHYQAAPWTPIYVVTAPDTAGPMSAAYREVSAGLRAEAHGVLMDDLRARGNRDAHRVRYGHVAGVYWQLNAREGTAPAVIDRSSGGASAAIARRAARLAATDVHRDDTSIPCECHACTIRAQYAAMLDPEPTEHKGRGVTPRLSESWDLARAADELFIADEMADHLAGRRFLRSVDSVDIYGRPVAYVDDARPTVASSHHADVWDRSHGRMTVRPDRVAFRGVARYRRPQPCRYVAASKARTTVVAWARIAPTADIERAADLALIGMPSPLSLARWTVTHLVTRITRTGAPTTVHYGAPGMAGDAVTGGTRSVVATVRSDRAGKAGTKRGPKRDQADAWTTATAVLARSLKRADLVDVAARYLAALDAATPGAVVALAPGHDVIVARRMDSRGRTVLVIVDDKDRTMSPREYAARAALAGVA